MTDIYVSNGSTVDEVTTYQNAANVDLKPTPIMEVAPKRGQFLRFFNRNVNGNVGLPCFFDLNDSNGDDLPTNTLVVFELQVANGEDYHRASVPLKQIAFFNNNSVPTQRDDEKRHNAVIPLKWPEASDNSGLRDHLDVRDVDSFTVSIISTAQVDWSQSEFYFAREAVKEFSRE